MRRATAHFPSPDMALLGLVEGLLSFLVIYTVIQSSPLTMVASILPHHGIAVAATLTLIISTVALTIGLYRSEVCLDRKRLMIAAGLATIITFAVLIVIDDSPSRRFSSDLTLYTGKVIGSWLVVMALIRLTYRVVINPEPTIRRVLLIGDHQRVSALSARMRFPRGRQFGAIVHTGPTTGWPTLCQQGIWGVVIASEPDEKAVETLLDCKFRGMRILSGAAFQEHHLGRLDVEALTANDLLLGSNLVTSRISVASKRLCDIVVSTAMLILLLPMMALTALAIKIDSPGPIFYRQQRVGRFGTAFTLYKFRSMTADAEANGNPVWAQTQDPRITRIGRTIRATRIDELPQLVNVMRGEMSMVGPRPERPHFVEQLARAIPFYRQRSYVKPGLTGWAQINFPYGASVADAREKLAYDLYYVKNRSVMLDLIILFSTVRVVLFREGAR